MWMKMKNYKRLTKWSDLGTLHIFDFVGKEIPLCDVSPLDSDNLAGRLAELEDKIESGELVDRDEYIDRLMAAKDISGMTDKELEFFAKHNARVRECAMPKMSRLINENAELRERLDKAIELSVKVGDTVYCIRNCGTGRYRIEAHTVIEIVFEYDNQMRIKTSYGLFGYEKWTFGLDCFADPAEAEARLKELQGGR